MSEKKLSCQKAPPLEYLVIGIDPGLSAGVAAISGRGGYLYAMDAPVKKVKAGGSTPKGNPKMKTIFDEQGMVAFLRDMKEVADERGLAIVAAVEHVHQREGDRGGQTKGGKQDFGRMKGLVALLESKARWIGMLVALDIPWAWAMPGLWSPAMVGKKSGNPKKDKEMARQVALKLFPNAPITRKMDHNRAEALLIAEYHRRKLCGELPKKPRTKKVVRRKK